jgi:hypothetical protein
MARSRNIKPGFFLNEVLGVLPPIVRLIFIGLWTVADREGRFEYRPLRLKAATAPYDDVNVEDAISSLIENGFLLAYEVNGMNLLQIVNWSKHQNPHHKEIASVFPPPPGHSNGVCDGYIPLSNTIRNRIYARDGKVCKSCGAKHGLSIDHIIPISKGGNSTDDNLQVLCMGCNFSKSNKILPTINASSMHESTMLHTQVKKNASCPTDSLNLIPDSLSSDSLHSAVSEKISLTAGIWENVNQYALTWEKAYPAINIKTELEKAAAWLQANPKNKKSNYARFLNSWLSRAQDKAPRVNGSPRDHPQKLSPMQRAAKAIQEEFYNDPGTDCSKRAVQDDGQTPGLLALAGGSGKNCSGDD